MTAIIFFLIILPSFIPVIHSQSYSIPINSTNNQGPSPRQYHSGITFRTWNKTNMDNTCPSSKCGPFCNNTDITTCTVPSLTNPVYSSKINPGSTPNYTILNLKCPNECCSNEYCFRALNKNGDDLTTPSEEVLLIFGGKVLNSFTKNPSCYWSFPIQLCDETPSNDLWFFFMI